MPFPILLFFSRQKVCRFCNPQKSMHFDTVHYILTLYITFWHCALHLGWLSSSGIDLGITMQIFKWFKNKLWPTIILFAKQNIYQWCHCIIWFWKVPLNLSWFTQKHNSRTTPLSFIVLFQLTLSFGSPKSLKFWRKGTTFSLVKRFKD